MPPHAFPAARETLCTLGASPRAVSRRAAAHALQEGAVHQLALRATGLAGVKLEPAFVARAGREENPGIWSERLRCRRSKNATSSLLNQLILRALLW